MYVMSEVQPEPAPSEIERRVRLLERTPAFDNLDAGSLRAMARRMRALELGAGETIATGASGDELALFVDAGDCTHTVRDGAGEVVRTIRPQAGDRIIGPADAPTGAFEGSLNSLSGTRLLMLDRQAVAASLGANAAEFLGELTRLAERDRESVLAAQPGDGRSATVIAVFSPKGGSGLTTLAVNLAAVLARARPNQVLVLDLALPFGHAQLYTDTVVTSSLATASRAANGEFRPALWSAIHPHASGIHLLPGAFIAEESDLVTGELVQRALEALREAFGIIVVDLGNTLNEVALAVFEEAARVVIVLPPELAALHDVRRTIEILEELVKIPSSRIDLVLNHRAPQSPLDQPSVERVLGRRISLVVGYDGPRPEQAVIAGRILALTDQSSTVAAASWQLAAMVAGKAMVSGPTQR
jgi:Flp pilus assembly CpaE family ATPase